MTDLKLAKLPDRTPVRITVALAPELHQALRDYADAYRAAYGQEESVADLIPFMLEAFLGSDRGFARTRKPSPAALKSRHARSGADISRAATTNIQED